MAAEIAWLTRGEPKFGQGERPPSVPRGRKVGSTFKDAGPEGFVLAGNEPGPRALPYDDLYLIIS